MNNTRTHERNQTSEEAVVEKMPRHNQSLYHCLTLLGSSHDEAMAKVREAQELEATQGRQMMGSLI